MNIYLTEKQTKRKKRNNKIIDLYKSMQGSKTAIYADIAKKLHISSTIVYNVIYSHNHTES